MFSFFLSHSRFLTLLLFSKNQLLADFIFLSCLLMSIFLDSALLFSFFFKLLWIYFALLYQFLFFFFFFLFFFLLTSKIIIKKQQHNNKNLKVGTAISQTAAGVHRCTWGTCTLIARQDLGT